MEKTAFLETLLPLIGADIFIYFSQLKMSTLWRLTSQSSLQILEIPSYKVVEQKN